MFALAVAVVVSATPFPLPTIDGKPVAVTEGQKSFRLPMRFERARAFYEQQLGPAKAEGVTMKSSRKPTGRVLELKSTRHGDAWARAVVREVEGDAAETVVDVVWVITGEATDIRGNGKPMVQFVLSRSADVDAALKSIDHTEDIRR